MVLVAAFGVSGPASGQCDVVETDKLLASDGVEDAWFGEVVALGGGVALVGVTRDGDNGLYSGAAYLFEVATGQETSKLVPDDNAAEDFFGAGVAISGSLAIIGARADDDNGDFSGSAYVFDVSDPSNPVELSKFTPLDGDAGDAFGGVVAASGSLVVVSAPFDHAVGMDSGSAYLFDITDPVNPVERSKLLPEEGSEEDHFGTSCAIHGGVVVVGVPSDDPNGLGSGSAYLYDASDPSNPAFIAKLVPDDGVAGDVFGYAVTAGESIVVVGAHHVGDAVGAAYVFDAGTGAQISKIEPAEGRSGTTFGQSLCIAGDLLLVGAPDGQGFDGGSVYVYDLSVPANPTEAGQFHSADIGDFDGFGWSVAMSGSSALVGAPFEDEACGDLQFCNSGAAYVFDVSCAAPCPADLNADGQVDVADLTIVILLWGTDPGGPPDFDGDGLVGVTDLIQLVTAWGPCS
jgi:hypothetical protein